MTAGVDNRQVTVTLERSMRQMGRWQYPAWRLVHAEESAGAEAPSCQRRDLEDGRREFVWRGLTLTLYRDAGEGYWYNLSGSEPSLFLVCRADEDADDELRPVLATLNHDESAAHLETDDTVFSLPLPAGLKAWLEAFVDEYYQPQKRTKRARKNWSEETGREAPRASRPIRNG